MITGSTTRVRTTILTVTRDLGFDPTARLGPAVPARLDGSVAVVSFRSAPSATLSVRVSTTMNAVVRDAPSGLETCPVGKQIDLVPGQGCFVWNGSGASGTNISYGISPEGKVLLRVTGHSSAFAGEPGTLKTAGP